MILFFFAISISMALFLMPEVIIYFNFGRALINDFVIGVLSLMIKRASKSSKAIIASFSFKNGSLKTLKLYFSLYF